MIKMIHEDWWEEYKKKTVIMDKYDNPINIVIISIIIMILGMTIHIILDWNKFNIGDVYAKIMSLFIGVAIWLKAGESIWYYYINKNQKNKFKADEQIFFHCLKKYKKSYNHDIEEFLELICINNKTGENSFFSSIIFPLICSYLFAIPSMSENNANNIDESALYFSIVIILITFLACKYIIDFLYDILSKKKRAKKEEYKLAIIAKNHLYNIKKNKYEDSWSNIIAMIINKLQKK